MFRLFIILFGSLVVVIVLSQFVLGFLRRIFGFAPPQQQKRGRFSGEIPPLYDKEGIKVYKGESLSDNGTTHEKKF